MNHLKYQILHTSVFNRLSLFTNRIVFKPATFLMIAVLLIPLFSCSEQNVVNVYSSRHYDVDDMLLARFSSETGIRVNLVKADSDQLVTRLEMEGTHSPADVLITADAGRLVLAKELGLLQKIDSETISETVPAQWRDSDMHWTGLTKRVRFLVYHPDRIDPSGLDTYESLTGEKWKGRILVRSSNSHYNQTLLASIIAALGKDGAEEWASGIVANMAREPGGNDRDQVKFIAAGLGDVALVNSYYMGLLHDSPNAEERNIARQVKVFFPNQHGRGSHVNISGAGLTAAAPNKENGIRLIEFLTGIEAQEIIATRNFEYPVLPDVRWPDLLLEWGSFREDTVSLEILGSYREDAMLIFNRAGWK